MVESVPYQYINSTGLIVPDTAGILTDVQSEFKTAFAADLIVRADTPQGVLITAETLSRTAVVNNNAAVANEINPNTAGGVFLDAIMALSGMQRAASTFSAVNDVALTGVAGTVISAGSQARTAAGDVFATITNVTLDGSGNASANFQAIVAGPVACEIGQLTIVVTNVLGWETVTNASAAVLGTNTQTDQVARALRENTLAFQGVALPEAITSALYNVPGVSSLFFQENVADITQTINGISMISHSVYACVAGGTDLAVASALLENKSSGSGWNGDTSVSVIEPASGQTYAVKFDRPEQVGILVEVTTTNGAMDDITQAVLDYANGLIAGLKGFTVGSTVSAFEIAGAIMSEFPSYFIKLVRISLVSPIVYSTDEIPIGVNQQAFTQTSYITVIIAGS